MKHPIHLKIFFSFAVILLLSIFITLLFGHQVMERLYMQNKTHDLQRAYQAITEILLERDCDLTIDQALLDDFFDIEKNNTTIMLLTVKQQQIFVRYYSRQNWFLEKQPSDVPLDGCFSFSDKLERADKSSLRYAPQRWIADAAQLGVFQTASLPLLVTEPEGQQPGAGTLDYYGKVASDDQTIYVFLRTPREPLTLAAELAVRYNLYLALLSFLLTAIMSYFVARRITRPIEQINQATARISQMNFSQQCQIATGDELESLSNHINAMALKLQDYIAQLQVNQQLLEKDLQREAKTSQLRRQFIANVSHDFKTPLTLIRAYTETLRDQQLAPAAQRQYCEIILGESERMNHLVTQLLQLSKLESGMVQLEQTFFPIEELMREILYRNQLLTQQKNLHIHWDYGDSEHIVQGDYQRIEQALVNLVENAIKYTPEQGTIALEVTTLADALCRIAVTNTSPPLSDEELERLFISFYKTDESRHLDQQSFGLGLAIVKATMDLHQQTCTACNTPLGLQIAFTLPLLPDGGEDVDDENEAENETDSLIEG